MLVLSRKVSQSVRVGNDVRITIVRIDRNTVRVGIEAPDGMKIYREEIMPVACAFDAETSEAEALAVAC